MNFFSFIRNFDFIILLFAENSNRLFSYNFNQWKSTVNYWKATEISTTRHETTEFFIHFLVIFSELFKSKLVKSEPLIRISENFY